MRALVLIGALFGAAYTASVWLFVEHSGGSTPWNLLVIPVVLGSLAALGLIVGTLVDAINGGIDDRPEKP